MFLKNYTFEISKKKNDFLKILDHHLPLKSAATGSLIKYTRSEIFISGISPTKHQTFMSDAYDSYGDTFTI